MNKDFSKLGFSTAAIHAGQSPAPGSGSVMTPIHQTSTYAQSIPGKHQGYEYARTGNPTRSALEANLAELEGGKYSSCFSSGCAAADAIFHTLASGDHVICGDDVYGGTFRLLRGVFERLGVTSSFVDLTDVNKFKSAITKQTKLLWLETPTNPLLKIVDIELLCGEAKKQGITSVVDNTFASPYLQKPLCLGADIVLHSTTKYLGGHSDVIGGVIITNHSELAEKIGYLQNAIGAVPAPLDCFLLLRSTKTLAVRMEAHCRNAAIIADVLAGEEEIEEVYYPGLKTHRGYEIANKQMRLPGGMITIRLKGDLKRANRFFKALDIFTVAESLGGVESLANHPVIMTHASVPEDIRLKLGITDSIVRLSVGIEDVDDLVYDLKQALAA